MKCARHPFEGGVGVCAPCLRERLLALTATAPAPPTTPSPEHHPFPCSVSPYVSRSAAAGSRRSSILSVLFGRRGTGDGDKKPQRSSSWMSTLLHGRRRKKMSRLFSADDGAAAAAAAAPARDRGMSPHSCGGRNVESPGWQRRPNPSPMRRLTAEHHHHLGGGLAGFAMCFSPLVTASPSRRRARVAELGFSGEIPRASVSPHHRRHASTGGWPTLFPDRTRRTEEFGNFR